MTARIFGSYGVGCQKEETKASTTANPHFPLPPLRHSATPLPLHSTTANPPPTSTTLPLPPLSSSSSSLPPLPPLLHGKKEERKEGERREEREKGRRKKEKKEKEGERDRSKRFVSLNSGLSSKWRLPTPTSVIVPSAPKIGKPGLTALHLHLYHLSSTTHYHLSSTFYHTTTLNLLSIFCRLSTLLHSTTPPRQERRRKKEERKRPKLRDLSLLTPVSPLSGGYLLSHRNSTIGVIGLNCSVRYG
ncbi:MAG: hypothetical protein MR609_06210 [Bacteroidales bacterium]|nr:hypothetical protein [Bacteroidales bacterium]